LTISYLSPSFVLSPEPVEGSKDTGGGRRGEKVAFAEDVLR
jgi:hypothetical protein